MADLTGDGTLEVIVGRGGDLLTVYNRFGRRRSGRANPFGGGEVRTLAVADLENDGQLEIVVGRASGGATRQLNAFSPAAACARAGRRAATASRATAGACTTRTWPWPT